MALQHAILVSLCEQSGSGYELARRFESSPVASLAPASSIGYFWAVSHQQIYKTLRTMDQDGWVHVTPVEQYGRPDKKVYTVSEAGRAELARWISEPVTAAGSARGGSVADTRTRDLAVKVRAAAYGDVAALRTQVDALRDERAALLDTYRGYEKRQFPDPSALTGSTLHQYLVLRGGIRAEESAIDWLSEVSRALES